MANLLIPEINDETPIFDSEQRSATMRNYLCAKCWGELRCGPLLHDQWFVYCPRCGQNIGFVTRNYVEQKRCQDRIDRRDVDNILASLGIIEKEPSSFDEGTEERLLEELGF
jgi:DNA-directed RNA polymerase subunit RPC12/RpoP